jgi:hypothetical protein
MSTTENTRYTVAPHAHLAACELVATYGQDHRHDLAQLEQLTAEHGSDLVAFLVQDLCCAIRSIGEPSWAADDPEASGRATIRAWVQAEVERTQEKMAADVEYIALVQNDEMAALGIPEQYRDRLRAWTNGAPVEEILDRVPADAS